MGLTEEAEACLDELTESIAASESPGDAQEWDIQLVLGFVDADRSQEAREIVERLPTGVWRQVCDAVLDARYVAAAGLLETTGEQPLQAELRLRAAKQFVSEGKLGEAHEQLHRARAFWRTVGATAYLREADELLVAAS